MALIGISLIVASVVIFCLRPPAWLPNFLATLRQQRLGGPAPRPPIPPPGPDDDDNVGVNKDDDKGEEDEDAGRVEGDRPERLAQSAQPPPLIELQEPQEIQAKEAGPTQGQGNGMAMPPTPTIQLEEPREERSHASQDRPTERVRNEEEETTPKAAAATPANAVPSFVLSEPSAPREPLSNKSPQQAPPSSITMMAPPPQFKAVPDAPKTASELMPPPPPPSTSPRVTTSASSNLMMPPPPVPKPKTKSKPSGIPQPSSSSSSSPRRIPTLNGTASPAANRTLPIPRRGGGGNGARSSSASSPSPSSAGGGGGLAPPPTATSIPKKPSRQVNLEPGHSPLDWARLAQSATSDLRGLPANTPYLRVTPSMLKQQNGRKGRDAWSVFGGKVYNISPYIPFHPGGGPELLRGAGKDGTRLFAEVHPWVNYETMLQSCLIGLLVEEHEEGNKMEEMD